MKKLLLLALLLGASFLQAQWEFKLHAGAGIMNLDYPEPAESSQYNRLTKNEFRYQIGSQISYQTYKNGLALALDYGHISHPARKITQSTEPFHLIDLSLSYQYQFLEKWKIAFGPQYGLGFHNGLRLMSMEKYSFEQWGVHGGLDHRITPWLDVYLQGRYDGIGRTEDMGYWRSLSSFLGLRYRL